MSLQVWLPFTDGTLKQQGLSRAAATNGGTVNLTNVGKLGKCATLGTAAGGITLHASTMTSFTKCSVAFWVKIISWNTSYATLFQAGLGSTPWNNYIFGILRNNTNSNLCFTLTNSSSSSTNASYVSSNLEVGEWYHLAFVYDTGVCKIYINGVEDKSYNTSYVPNFAGITHISIGRSTNGSNYQTNCSLNDFRIYDHALSPMEVKWLSQGLILHYPLNRMGFGQDNLATCTTPQYTISASSTSNYNYFWINNSTLEPNTTYTFSAEVEVSDNITECTIYNYTSSGNSGSITSTFPADGKRHSWTFTTTTTGLGLIGYAGKSGATIGHSAIYRNIKVEKGDIATPYVPRSNETLYTTMGLNSTTEYDDSGFCNNGTRTGTFNWTSDTPKYQVSTEFDGSTSVIENSAVRTGITGDCEFTMAAWIYWNADSWRNDYVGIVGNRSYSTNIGAWMLIYAGKPDFDYWNNRYIATTALSVKTWYHIVITKTKGNLSTTSKIYVNGVEVAGTATSGANTTANFTDNGIKVGCANDTASRHFPGKICDVRIYATALSAEDVKSLYQNCATIDPDGTIRGQIRS